MKRISVYIFVIILVPILCSCMRRGPYPPQLHQSPDQVVKVEFVDGRNETELFKIENYNSFVLYTLEPGQTDSFMDGLLTVEFFIPGWEPSRHLGEIAARIYYKDGSSDLVGNNCNYYFDADFEILDIGVHYPDNESFYALFERYVDPVLLPRR